MGILSDWGFSQDSWRGKRGEYWFLLQAVLLIGFFFLPVYSLPGVSLTSTQLLWLRGGAATIGLVALVLLIVSLIHLGGNLTPLPCPRDDGDFVQTGIYGFVRHPLYAGLTLVAISWALFYLSLIHLIAAIILFAFLNAKANREEQWLQERFSDYTGYQKRVKKMIPWVY